MAEITISAVVTDGAAVLFEVVGPAAEGPVPALALPRFALGPDDESIEDALVAGVRASLGLDVTEQEFVETVYEQVPDGSGVRLNNLQHETGSDHRVEGVTTILQHRHPRSGGQPVRRSHHPESPDKLRTRGKHARNRNRYCC